MTWSPDVVDRAPHVLIVDDEPHNRHLMEVILAREGCVVTTAGDGAEALAIVARQPPDLILLDVMMPGMDGYEVAGRIKNHAATKNIPIIMVTALDDREAKVRGLRAGAEDFLTKPVDRAELCARVRNLFRLKAYGDYHNTYSQMLETEVGSRAADLVESERLYRETFDAAPIGILHVGLNGDWLRVNARLCDLLGYTREELLSVVVQARLHADDEGGAAASCPQTAAEPRDRHPVEERRYRRRDGRVMWARVNTSVHNDTTGHAQHLISVIEDITEQRALEAQFRQANKMDAVGQLAAGVAHDFSNLLTVILGFSDLIAADTDLPTQVRHDIEEITKTAVRASGLTKQLLTFSRQQILVTSRLDLNALITDMTGMLTRVIGEHVEVALALTPDLSPVLADRGQLEQVLMNLVVNARDAMPSGGRVTIATSDVVLENYPAHHETVLPGPYVLLAVTDAGMGMSPETQQRLFEPFFTTKKTGEGTGLGLSTVYGIITQSHGHIRVESELGRGTTFRVYLPRAADAVTVLEPRVVATEPVKAGSETVLLVEDEASVRQLLKGILRSAGYCVLEAANGNDAERVFHEHVDVIDVVVTDVVMPGCGGPELLDRLRVQAPALRALYMSGYPGRPARAHTGAEPEVSLLPKPFTAAELIRRVRETLDR